jgi:hypothetical protein
MTLCFFIDDSGKDDPPVFVLGGLAIEKGRLAAFENAWNDVLQRAPAIPWFKMKEANRRHGAFKGMSFADRDARLADLGKVLKSHAVATLSVVVRHEDYRQAFDRQMMRSMDRPYQIMFHLAIATGFKLCRQLGRHTNAEFVFDRQLEHENQLRQSFVSLREGMDPELAKFLDTDPRHADDKDEVALQAADLVAWHVRRSWRGGTTALCEASVAGSAIASLPGMHDLINQRTVRMLAEIAMNTVRQLNTVFPYEAERMGKEFDRLATIANLHMMAEAHPFHPVELISFPAIGTRKFLLVNKCSRLGRPHLHRRSENRCLGEASAVLDLRKGLR